MEFRATYREYVTVGGVTILAFLVLADRWHSNRARWTVISVANSLL